MVPPISSRIGNMNDNLLGIGPGIVSFQDLPRLVHLQESCIAVQFGRILGVIGICIVEVTTTCRRGRLVATVLLVVGEQRVPGAAVWIVLLLWLWMLGPSWVSFLLPSPLVVMVVGRHGSAVHGINNFQSWFDQFNVDISQTSLVEMSSLSLSSSGSAVMVWFLLLLLLELLFFQPHEIQQGVVDALSLSRIRIGGKRRRSRRRSSFVLHSVQRAGGGHGGGFRTPALVSTSSSSSLFYARTGVFKPLGKLILGMQGGHSGIVMRCGNGRSHLGTPGL